MIDIAYPQTHLIAWDNATTTPHTITPIEPRTCNNKHGPRFTLVKKARTGDYTPFTNTEQDIIEDFFPPGKGHAKPMNALIQHRHGNFAFPNCTTDWAAAVLASKSPSCTDMLHVYLWNAKY